MFKKKKKNYVTLAIIYLVVIVVILYVASWYSTYQNYKSHSGDKTKDDFYSTLTKIVDTSTYVILHANADDAKVAVLLYQPLVLHPLNLQVS